MELRDRGSQEILKIVQCFHGVWVTDGARFAFELEGITIRSKLISLLRVMHTRAVLSGAWYMYPVSRTLSTWYRHIAQLLKRHLACCELDLFTADL